MGNELSDEAKRELIKAKLHPGCILHVFCDFISPPHCKFIVVAHIDFEDDLLLLFLINSEVHAIIQNNPALNACQVHLLQEEYSFLDHDSYIDCSKIIDDFSVSEVIEIILENESNHKCELADKEKLAIIERVVNAITIPEFDKNFIVNSLGN